jgi:hypothetical protein
MLFHDPQTCINYVIDVKLPNMGTNTKLEYITEKKKKIKCEPLKMSATCEGVL